MEVDKVNDFLRGQSDHLNEWVSAILSRFSLATISPEIDELTQVASTELHDLGECLSEALTFCSQLEEFVKLNDGALQRLLAKRAKFGCLESANCSRFRQTRIATPWHGTVACLRDLLDLSRRAQGHQTVSSDTQSLLLRRVSPVALGCTSDVVHRCIRDDDPASLMVALASPVSYLENQAMLYSVLQVAINYRATMCIRSLLEEITAPLEDDSCGHQDALHQLVIQFSRCQPTLSAVETLVEIFRELSPYQHHMLLVRDWRLRTPLHYAAAYGWPRLCQQLVKFVDSSLALQPDASGLTPLHLAASNGHVSVIKSLLAVGSVRRDVSEEMAGNLLHLSIQAKSPDVLESMLSIRKGISVRDGQGRTPLYAAVARGDIDMTRALLISSKSSQIDRVENTYGWSPLIVASVRGYQEVVELLLQQGADTEIRDCRGWSAVEHASYRAHMSIVDALQATKSTAHLSVAPASISAKKHTAKPVTNQRPTITSTKLSLPEEFDGRTAIYVNLGSFDPSAGNNILDLDASTESGSGMGRTFLEMSAAECHEAPYLLSLPFVGDITETTWRFTTTNSEDMKLRFKIFEYPDDTKAHKRLLATGIVLLNHLKGWFRPGRQSLKRECTAALTSPEGEYAGTITFTHILCLPYKAPGSARLPQTMCQTERTQVVGHRGLGWNMAGLGRMQLGEHTIQSLQSSLDQGADLIEFDVQLTRDSVPVIYHDWSVSETGLDVPVHSMTFKQVSITQVGLLLHRSDQFLTQYSGWLLASRKATSPRTIREGACHGTRELVLPCLLDELPGPCVPIPTTLERQWKSA